MLALVALVMGQPETIRSQSPGASVLSDCLLVTYYGNPNSPRMGVLGQLAGAALADGLRRQGAAYEGLTTKRVLMAYQLVTVVAQGAPGRDGMYRRRESQDIVRALLDEARRNGFKLVLDVQPGRASVAGEVEALATYLSDPDVYLALDPEFAMRGDDVPGVQIGQMQAADINAAIDILERVIREGHLPPKVLIVHQFRWDMLPDKSKIKKSACVDVVLNMDGFGGPALKRSSYHDVMRQGQLPFAGIKLFYQEDDHLLTPAQVMMLTPRPSVVIYQ
jgi:hypothetical protein